MDIVSAGVHDPVPLRAVLGPRLLLDGQGVNIRPQGDGRTCSTALQGPQHTGLPHAGMGNARRVQLPLNHRRGSVLPQRQFGMAVQFPPDGRQIRALLSGKVNQTIHCIVLPLCLIGFRRAIIVSCRTHVKPVL